MKMKLSLVLALAVCSSVRAEEVAPAAAEAAPAEVVAPAAPVAAPPAVADKEEVAVLVGRLDSKTGGGGDTIRVLTDKATGKRYVLPSHAKQLPADFVWGEYPGDISVKALLWTRVRDGKTQVIVKRILELTPVAPAAEPAATPAPEAAEATPAPEVAP